MFAIMMILNFAPLPRFDESKRVAYSEGTRVALAAPVRDQRDMFLQVIKVTELNSDLKFDLRGPGDSLQPFNQY